MFTLQDNGDYAFTDAQRNVWGTIDVNVTIADTGEVIPFTVDPQDSEEYGRALWDQINARYLHLVAPLPDAQRDAELAEMARDDETKSSKQPTGHKLQTCRRRLALPGPLTAKHSVMYQRRAGSQPKLPGPHPHLESWTSGLTKTGSRSSRLWRPQVKLTHSITSVR